jgi:hypothetical protein
MCKKGRQHELSSVIEITLRFIFALSHNASTLWRKVIAFDSYRSMHVEIVIASYCYRSGLIRSVIAAFYSYRSQSMTKAITCNAVRF